VRYLYQQWDNISTDTEHRAGLSAITGPLVCSVMLMERMHFVGLGSVKWCVIFETDLFSAGRNSR